MVTSHFLLITSKAAVHDHMQGFCILTPRGALDGWILSVSLPQAAKIFFLALLHCFCALTGPTGMHCVAEHFSYLLLVLQDRIVPLWGFTLHSHDE